MNTPSKYINLGHITHAYMVSLEGSILPMFEMDNGEKFYPRIIPTGNCWALYWVEEKGLTRAAKPSENDPVITPPDEQGKANISHLGYVLIGMVAAMVVMLIVIVYGYGLF